MHVNTTAKTEAQFHGQRKGGQRQDHSRNGASVTGLSSKTLGRLGAFRFQPPQKAATGEAHSERFSTQSAPLMHDEASPVTVSPSRDRHESNNSRKSHELLNSEKTTEATLPLENDLLACSRMTDDEHLLNALQAKSSPSPFEADDFDQESLEGVLRSIVDVDDTNPHAWDKKNVDNLILNSYVAHESGPADSDFGSDPFGPDDDDDIRQEELHEGSSVPTQPFGSPPSQPAEVDSPRPQANFASVLPRLYQTPSKSPPNQNTPTKLPGFQPITPNSGPPHANNFSPKPSLTPFLRPKFPTPVALRSPISNLDPTPRILTCFRTAEYLRIISSFRSTAGPLIELYALVTSSTRAVCTQHFTFADLFFPQHPPHLQGTCRTWQGIELYEGDTRPFLLATREKGKLCRAVVRPKKLAHLQTTSVGSSPLAGGFATNSGSPDWAGGEGAQVSCLRPEVEVLNIWEAGWEDVEYVRGIVGA